MLRPLFYLAIYVIRVSYLRALTEIPESRKVGGHSTERGDKPMSIDKLMACVPANGKGRFSLD